MAKPTPELDLLAPRDPELQNTDEWPELALTNAYAHLPGKPSDLASILEAAAGYPLTVAGQLEPLEDEDRNLYLELPQGKVKRVPIVLEDVRMFSYGQLDDGTSAIWAAGKAGWYTITPAKKYQSIYAEMCEAVDALYFVADAYRTPRIKGRGKTKEILPEYTAAELFAKYATVLGSDDHTKGQEMIYKHKDFLMSSMLAGKEGLSWSRLPIYKHLYGKFPDVVAKARKKQEPLVEAKEPKSEKLSKAANSDRTNSRHTRKSSGDTTSSTSSLKRKRARPARNGPVEIISLDGTSDASSAVVASGSMVEVEETVQEMLSPKTKGTSTRRTRQKVTSIPEEKSELGSAAIATPAKDEDSDGEIRARNQKNKSSLRPRASKASKSASRRGGKGPPREDEDDGVNDLDPPSPTGGKRKYEDGDEVEQVRRRPRRRNSKPHDDEGIDMPTSPEAASSPTSSTDGIDHTTDLPIRPLNMGHVEDPVQEDTWVCALDGCTHKVYAASHPESQRLIREHYALHAYDDDERVQMVKRLQAPSLPVSRLMDKVKAQAKNDGFPGSAAGMPENIKSRFGPEVIGSGVVIRY
ncbi:uncharacterized protein MYCFIDRAFT_173186 [Pseudocercospora fijiensis CIRAD86]|uniref:DNA (cytosine-5)-methyltransferase 1 replication foci domain-containing protein n=1 Tax=Pseudocercospora fijiensis (strain CIRAD86) TaxID=383855 RepID=M3B437_PSEFD|nr:uncharacterized protein MYCFIDRAFT_173186 [Pseudocercospora fijiensis CIRAD86]EME84143.1 hypothetical protein MYCFIDRAFT_173186 [Pseudocercospora fijiensis CIRAD86]